VSEAVRVSEPDPPPCATFDPLTFESGEPRADLTKAAALAAEFRDDEFVSRYRRR
jgi:hypothetical protein